MISHRSLVACVAVMLAALSTSSFAQSTASQSAAIPSPSRCSDSPGDDRTIADWSQITGFRRTIGPRFRRVLVQNLGQSTLKRPVIVAFISARENILALPKYKEIQQQYTIHARSSGTLSAIA